MTIQYDEDKPSPEDVLHYGVVGMKWGKRRAKASGKEIRSARKRLSVEQDKLFDKQDSVKKTGKGQRELANMTTKFLKNPDRVTAVRLTRGEKAAAFIIFPPAGAATIALTSGISRRIEKKQDAGAYDKK